MNKDYSIEKRFTREKLVKNWGPSLTKQEFKDEVDINNIINKALRGEFVRGAVNPGFYDDVSAVGDYHDMQDRMLSINDEFMKMPPEIRARFHHDPSLLVEWVNNPINKAEAIELGLLEPEPKVTQNNPSEGSTEPEGGAEAPAEA